MGAWRRRGGRRTEVRSALCERARLETLREQPPRHLEAALSPVEHTERHVRLCQRRLHPDRPCEPAPARVSGRRPLGRASTHAEAKSEPQPLERLRLGAAPRGGGRRGEGKYSRVSGREKNRRGGGEGEYSRVSGREKSRKGGGESTHLHRARNVLVLVEDVTLQPAGPAQPRAGGPRRQRGTRNEGRGIQET